MLLAVLSLLPARVMVRTGLPGGLEHLAAYAGAAAIAMVGYGRGRSAAWVIAGFWVYAGVLEYLQNFSPGRDVGMADVAVSALGAVCGVIAAGLLWRRLSSMLPPQPAQPPTPAAARMRQAPAIAISCHDEASRAPVPE
jgi:VanZ family protein